MPVRDRMLSVLLLGAALAVMPDGIVSKVCESFIS